MHSSTATSQFETVFAIEGSRRGSSVTRSPLLDGFCPQAMKLTRDRTDAEDLLQETAAKAFAGFSRVSTTAPTSAAGCTGFWSTPTSAATANSSAAPVQWLTEEITDGQPARRGPSLVSRPALRGGSGAVELVGDNDVRAAMQQLPEKLRTAVCYADIEGRRFKEIGRASTGAPIGTVMSRLATAAGIG